MAFKSLLALSSLATIVSAANYRRVACPDGVNTATNAACCAFFSLRDDLLENVFDEACGEEVHESVRLMFHDAIGFSKSQGPSAGGGADGSPLQFPNVEPNFHANLGIADSVEFLTPFLSRHNVTAGDLIHFAGAVGFATCPGSVKLEFLAGRAPAQAPSIDGLVPEPQDPIDQILERMNDGGGFSADDVIALLTSHSIARADHVDPTLDAAPFDSTPFTFDSQFFVEVQLKGTGFPGTSNNTGEVASPLPQGYDPNVGELRLQSDFGFARDSRTACTFQSFVNNQAKMQSEFLRVMKVLSTIGQDRNSLVDCTEVIQDPTAGDGKDATFPAGKTIDDVEQACAATPFPTLATDPGQETDIPHCADGGDDCDS